MNWLREPIVHFIVLGAMFFGLNAWLGRESDLATKNSETVASGQEVIRITSAELTQIRTQLEESRRRSLSEEELNELIQEYTRQKVLSTEARRLGLDQDDPIIRARLVEKMEFLISDEAMLEDPSEAELIGFLKEHADHYRKPAVVSFIHVYLDPAKRSDAQADAASVLARLHASPEEWNEQGDEFPLSRDYKNRSEAQISRRYGEPFAKALFELPVGQWTGPVQSEFGLHLVRIDQRKPPAVPELQEILASVQLDYRRSRRDQANRDAYEDLLRRYRIIIEGRAGGNR